MNLPGEKYLCRFKGREITLAEEKLGGGEGLLLAVIDRCIEQGRIGLLSAGCPLVCPTKSLLRGSSVCGKSLSLHCSSFTALFCEKSSEHFCLYASIFSFYPLSQVSQHYPPAAGDVVWMLSVLLLSSPIDFYI